MEGQVEVNKSYMFCDEFESYKYNVYHNNANCEDAYNGKICIQALGLEEKKHVSRDHCNRIWF